MLLGVYGAKISETLAHCFVRPQIESSLKLVNRIFFLPDFSRMHNLLKATKRFAVHILAQDQVRYLYQFFVIYS